MKIFSHLPRRCVSRPIDPARMMIDSRGLTGSESAWIFHMTELARRGHSVELWGNFANRLDAGNVSFHVDPEHPDQNFQMHPSLQGADAIVSWMSPDACVISSSGALRVYVEQCCDHGNTPYAWENNVDLFCTLSNSHARLMSGQNRMPLEKCRVVPNGVDLDDFKPGKKVPGKVIWASSHDRGLHHLLGMWPRIKRSAPHATLDVFYDDSGMRSFADMPVQSVDWLEELRRRSVYELDALPRLERLDVRMRGSASRRQISAEMAEAEILAYPCDPVRAGVETFGSTVLEAMASECVPVLCLADAFDELWGGACPGTLAPFKDHRERYENVLIALLKDSKLLAGARGVARAEAERYSWKLLGDRFEKMILTRGVEGFSRPVV